VKTVALKTEYIVRERYLNATECLNIIIEHLRVELASTHNLQNTLPR
jgi:hypothetical protein